MMRRKLAIASAMILLPFALSPGAKAAEACVPVEIERLSGKISEIKRTTPRGQVTYLSIKSDMPYCGTFYRYNSSDIINEMTEDVSVRMPGKDSLMRLRVGDHVGITGGFLKRSSSFGFDHWSWEEFVADQVTVIR